MSESSPCLSGMAVEEEHVYISRWQVELVEVGKGQERNLGGRTDIT